MPSNGPAPTWRRPDPPPAPPPPPNETTTRGLLEPYWPDREAARTGRRMRKMIGEMPLRFAVAMEERSERRKRWRARLREWDRDLALAALLVIIVGGPLFWWWSA